MFGVHNKSTEFLMGKFTLITSMFQEWIMPANQGANIYNSLSLQNNYMFTLVENSTIKANVY